MEKAGYVNLQRVVTECAEGKRLRAEIEAFKAVKQAEVSEAEVVLQNLTTGKKVPATVEVKRAELTKLIEQANAELTQRDQEATAKILSRAQAIFPKVAKARKMSMLLPLQSVVYIVPTLDVTDEIIKRLDA